MAKTVKDTLHYQARKTQRGLTTGMLDLAAQFGEPLDDGTIVFSAKAAQSMIAQINKMKEELMRLAKRGGAVLVSENGVNITAYGLDSYKHA